MRRKLVYLCVIGLAFVLVSTALLSVGIKKIRPVDCDPYASPSIAQLVYSGGSLTFGDIKLSPVQMGNASKIHGVAVAGGLSTQASIVAFETAMQESGLRALKYGYPGSSSVGLFQQTAPWGTYAARKNPVKSATMFFFGGQDGQSGLTDIEGWENMAPGEAAQAVQRSNPLGSGDPERDHAAAVAAYAKHHELAEAILQALVGDSESATSVALPYECEKNDPVEDMVLAALSREGDEYAWEDSSGTGLISWAATEAGFSLPSNINDLYEFRGDSATGVSAKMLPADSPVQRGDIPFWSSDDDLEPEAAGIGLGVTAGELSRVRIATDNVLGSNHTSYDSAMQRISTNAAVITKQMLSVVGLQELRPNQRTRLMQLIGDNYDIYPNEPVYGSSQMSANSIIWDESQFQFVSGRATPMPFYLGGQPLDIPIVELRHVLTDTVITVVNTHDPAHPENARYRYLNAIEHAELAERLTAQGSLVFFTGDFNSGFSLRSEGNVTHQNDPDNLTTRIMSKSGVMVNGYDDSSGLATCPEGSTDRGDFNPVDHVFVPRDGVDTAAYCFIREGTGSDHPVVFVDVALGSESSDPFVKENKWKNAYVGLSDQIVDVADYDTRRVTGVLRLTVTSLLTTLASGSGEWVFPLQKGTYTFSVNSYGPRSLNGDDYHNGTDFGTGGAEPPLIAMHDGEIVAWGYEGAWGNHLVVETGVAVPGMPGETYKYLYAHLSTYAPGIVEGSTVSAGQLVGFVGNSGNSFGEHLHLTICTTMECTYGNAAGSTDPIPFLAVVGIRP